MIFILCRRLDIAGHCLLDCPKAQNYSVTILGHESGGGFRKTSAD